MAAEGTSSPVSTIANQDLLHSDGFQTGSCSSGFDSLLQKLATEHRRELAEHQSRAKASQQRLVAKCDRQVAELKATAEACQMQVASLRAEIARLQKVKAADPSAQPQGQIEVDAVAPASQPVPPQLQEDAISEAPQLFWRLAEAITEASSPAGVSDILEPFRAGDASLAEEDSQGGSLFHLCASLPAADTINVTEALTLLAEKRCDPSKSNTLGDTPILCAVRKGAATAVIETLLSLGANPNVGNLKGVTPLLQAVRSVNTEVVLTLLKGRAAPNAADNFGETALMQAAASCNAELCQMLLTWRAHVMQANDIKLTALDFADDPSIARLLRRSVTSGALPDSAEQVAPLVSNRNSAQGGNELASTEGTHGAREVKDNHILSACESFLSGERERVTGVA